MFPASENIKVAVRVRQLNERELGYKNNQQRWTVDATRLTHPPQAAGGEPVEYNFGDFPDHTLLIAESATNLRIPFFFLGSWCCTYHAEMAAASLCIADNVFAMEDTTNSIYDKVGKGIVNSVVEGYNGTLFCYGQTSSGKTFTMTGTEELDGVVQFAVRDMFRQMNRAVDRKFQARRFLRHAPLTP